jgi:hypothetical protein
MKHIALIAFTFLSFALHAQTLYMKSGAFTPPENVKTITDFSSWSQYRIEDKTFCLVQFGITTSPEQRAAISTQTGIIFYEYFPKSAFLAAIPKDYNVNSLSAYNIRSILPFEAKYKIASKLIQRPLPSWMDKGNGNLALLLELQHTIDQSAAVALFNEKNIKLISWKDATHAIVEINESNLQTLASYAWVKYMSQIIRLLN